MHQEQAGEIVVELEIAKTLSKSLRKTRYEKLSVIPELGIQFLPFGDKTYPDVQEHL
jgi:hypothetical protein